VELLAYRIDEVTRPTLLQFGSTDVFIPLDSLERLHVAAAAKPNVEIEVYDAGHAFDNPYTEWFAPEVAAPAWDRTAAFLAAHLASS
jgi:carboxymethylenebutenolidase